MQNAEIIWKSAMQNSNLSKLMKEPERQINGQFSWSPATRIRRSAWKKTVLKCKQLSIWTIFRCASFSSIHKHFHTNIWRYPKVRMSVCSVCFLNLRFRGIAKATNEFRKNPQRKYQSTELPCEGHSNASRKFYWLLEWITFKSCFLSCMCAMRERKANSTWKDKTTNKN